MHAGPLGSERGTIALGIVLLVIGGLALLGRLLSIDILGLGWPLFVLIPGILLFAGGVAIGGQAGLGLAVPGGVVSMVGVVLSVQAASGLFATWAYAWALVAPGGVGLGILLYGILTGQPEIARNGIPILLTGLGLFVAFGLFFEGVLHLSGGSLSFAEPVLAGGLIVLGVLILFAGLTGRRPGPEGPRASVDGHNPVAHLAARRSHVDLGARDRPEQGRPDR